MLLGLDGDEGSVGSEDTTNCSLSDFGDYEERPPEERREPLGGGAFVGPAQVCQCSAVKATFMHWRCHGVTHWRLRSALPS